MSNFINEMKKIKIMKNSGKNDITLDNKSN